MSSGTTPRPSAGLTALATATAVVAVVTVLVSGAVASQKYAGRGSDPVTAPSTAATTQEIKYAAPSDPASVFPGGQVIYGDGAANVSFEVPDTKEGWSKPQLGWGNEYPLPDSYSGPKPRVMDPSYFDQGFCTKVKGTYRAYAGLGVTAEHTDDVRAAHLELVKAFRVGLTKEKHGVPPTVGTPQQATVDGGTAYQTSLVVKDGDDPCDAPHYKITILSVDSGDNVAAVILVRDQGQAGDLSDAMAAKILGSVKVLGD